MTHAEQMLSELEDLRRDLREMVNTCGVKAAQAKARGQGDAQVAGFLGEARGYADAEAAVGILIESAVIAGVGA